MIDFVFICQGDAVFSLSMGSKPHYSVLMVCMANICRSPTAEAVLKQRLKSSTLKIKVDSAGTSKFTKGTRPDARAVKVGEARGYNFSGIRSRMITSQDFEQFDLILAMDKNNLLELQAKCPAQYQSKLALLLSYGDGLELEVPDPYYGGSRGFELVLDLIENATIGLANEISAKHR